MMLARRLFGVVLFALLCIVFAGAQENAELTGTVTDPTGAVIAAEAQRRSSGYYWWRSGCYYRYPNGAWLQVQPGYCAY